MDPDRRARGLALAVCLGGGFIVFLDVSVVNVALPTLSQHLHASGSGLQWIVSGYALAFGLLLVPSGRLGDIHGHRILFVIGLSVFVAASAVCGAAGTSTVLVVSRIIQGAAGGVLTPQISATIQTQYSGDERARAFGLFASTAALASAVGPLIGGLLIAAFGSADGWRAVFYVNVPVGLVLIPLAVMKLPARSVVPGRKVGLDRIGTVLLGIGILAILLPFIESGWGSWRWSLLAVAGVDLVVLVLWEQRATDPVIDLRLFRDRSYSVGLLVITAYFAAFTPLFFIFTLYLQLGLGYSAVAAGAAITPFAVGSGVSAIVSGRLAKNHGRAVIVTGLGLMLVGFLGSIIAVIAVPDRASAWATLAPILVAGIGGGLVIAPNQTLALATVPLDEAGTAGGLLQTGQRVGASIGIAVAGAAFFAALRNHQSFPDAYRDGVGVIAGIAALALVIALVDWRRRPVPGSESTRRRRIRVGFTRG